MTTNPVLENDLKAAIRRFRITPGPASCSAISPRSSATRGRSGVPYELAQPWAGSKVDKVAVIEAHGFILGGAVARQVSAGFVPIRKKGKLPHTTR